MPSNSDNLFIKDPNAVLDYNRDWSNWVITGDTIISSDWFISDFGLSADHTATSTLTIDSTSFAGNITTVWLSGGEANSQYFVVNRVVTANGRTDDRHIRIRVMER